MPQESSMPFGVLLREYREQCGFSQSQLAEAAGLSLNAISALERGERLKPYPDTVARLMAALTTQGLTPAQQDRLRAAIRTARARGVPPVTAGSLSVVDPLQTLWHVPARRNPFFTGREAVLTQLHTVLTSASRTVVTHAITGLGGIGKTQTALEYAYRYQAEYQAVFWVQAETREHVLGEVAHLATVLQLPKRQTQDQAIAVAAVRRWLERHPGWLLVLDNVEELRQIQEVLPTRGSGHVLLTTRTQAPGSIEGRVRVERLPTEEAIHFLLRRAQLLVPETPLAAASPEQQQVAGVLVEALGGLPLALDQAGAYIEETGCGLAGYLELYRKRRQALLSHRGEGASDHPEAVGVTWAMAFEQVQQRSPAAEELLRVCAFLAPEGIPEWLFVKKEGDDSEEAVGDLEQTDEAKTGDKAEEKPKEPVPSALREAASDPIVWNAALAALRRFSLVDRQVETETLLLHRLVQVVVQEALPETLRREWAVCAVRLISRSFPEPDYASWDACQQLLPHALACVEHVEEQHLAFPEAALLLYEVGAYLSERARYTEALPLYQRALRMWEQTLGETHPTVATLLSKLARLYRNQGDYVQALPLYQRALAIREQVLGSDHPDVATLLSNLASFYRDQGDYVLALPLYHRALVIRQQVLGPEHPDVAARLNSHALLSWDQGKVPEALVLFQRALKIQAQALGPEHFALPPLLEQLASFYQDQGNGAEAQILFRRALSIRRRVLGPAHPYYAISLSKLASFYLDQGGYAQALVLFQRAMSIREQALGPEHPAVATLLEKLAPLFRELGRGDEGAASAQRAQAIRARRS